MIAHLFALSLALSPAVPVHGDDDHEVARQAVLQGRALPLETILERARSAYGQGRVLEAELTGETGALVYEIKMLTGDGRVLKLYYDARDAHLLKVRGKDHRP